MDFLTDNDTRWLGLESAHKVSFNPQPILRILSDAPQDKASWEKLWQELHHQGDIGTASYVAAVYLIALRQAGVVFDWNFYAFIAAIEAQRHVENSPKLPDWLSGDYHKSWQSITLFCIEDMTLEGNLDVVRAYLSVLAFAKGHIELGSLLIAIEASEIKAYLEER